MGTSESQTREAIQAKIKTALEEYATPQLVGTLTDESNIKEALDLDSLDMVEMVMAVEETFGIEVPDEDAEKLLTFGQMTDYLLERATQ